jgi:hypothetical protein
MTPDDLIEMWHKAWPDKGSFVRTSAYDLEAFAKLVADKATDEANARANASWTLMCKKMVEVEREACAEIVWPKLKIWSEEEQTAMGLAFNRAQERHGWYETLMAVGASVLKMKAEAIRARGEA